MRMIRKRGRKSGVESKSFGRKIAPRYFVYLFVLAFMVLSIFYYTFDREVETSESIKIDLKDNYRLNELLSGVIEISSPQGVASENLIVEIIVGDSVEQFPLDEILDYSPLEKSVSYEETQVHYPDVSFEMVVYSVSEENVPEGGVYFSPSDSTREDAISGGDGTGLTSEPSTTSGSNRPSGGGSSSGSFSSTPGDSFGSNDENSFSGSGEETPSFGSAPGSIIEGSPDSFGGLPGSPGGFITGTTGTGLVSLERKSIVSGVTKRGEPYSYRLNVGEFAEISEGSVYADGKKVDDSNVRLSLEDGTVFVSTDYSESKVIQREKIKVNLAKSKIRLTENSKVKVNVLSSDGVVADLEKEVIVGNRALEFDHSRPEVGENVVWTGVIELGGVSSYSFDLPTQAKDITVRKYEQAVEREIEEVETVNEGSSAGSITGAVVDASEFTETRTITLNAESTLIEKVEVEFVTDGPMIEETETSRGKLVKISGPDDVEYADVLAKTEIPEEFALRQTEDIKIYWFEEEEYVEPEKVLDRNSDGVFDYVEWNVKHLSEQNFEIILVTHAEHLDSGRNFVSDIYTEVSEQDDVWSETISDGEFVRIRFERALDSTKDITIFPRILTGEPTIGVYVENEELLIASFETLSENTYNRVLLSELEGLQDTFDLKVMGGSVEFDHIIDPAGVCSGIPHSCSSLSQVECGSRFETGCFWATTGQCTGSHPPCSSFISSESCLVHECSWILASPMAPSVTLNSPEDGASVNGEALLDLVVTDDTPVSVRIYGTSSENIEFAGEGGLLREENGVVSGMRLTYLWDALSVVPDGDSLFLYHLDKNDAYGEADDFVRDFSQRELHAESFGATHGVYDGKFAGAYSFDGADDYLEYSNNVLFGTASQSYEYTLAAWVYPGGSLTERAGIVSLGLGDVERFSISVSSDRPQCNFDLGDEQAVAISSDSFESGEWSHVACTYRLDANNILHLAIFVDGEMTGSAAYESDEFIPGSFTSIRIGADFSDEIGGFKGVIDEVAGWGREFSPTEISGLAELSSGSYSWVVAVNDGENAVSSETRSFSLTGNTVYISSCATLDQANKRYVLTQDLTTTTTCFRLNAHGISLDGGGHSVRRVPPENGIVSGVQGVLSNGKNDVSVRNLVLENFDMGINLIGAHSGAEISDNRILNSVQRGISVVSGTGDVFERNEIIGGDNADNLLIGLYVQSGGSHEIKDNVLEGNKQTGITLSSSSGNLVEANELIDNGFESGVAAITVSQSSENTVRGNQIDYESKAGKEGIRVFGVQDSENVFDGNVISETRRAGINLVSTSGNSFEDNELVLTLRGFRLENSGENTISGGYIQSDVSPEIPEGEELSNVIELVGDSSDLNVFDSVDILRTGSPIAVLPGSETANSLPVNPRRSRDIFIADGVDETVFENMALGSFAVSGKIVLKKSNVGEIRLLEKTNQGVGDGRVAIPLGEDYASSGAAGEDFSSAVEIADNLVSIDSENNPSLNRRAEITIHNLRSKNFDSPVILRDGVPCSTSVCELVTSLDSDSDSVTFRVSQWSSYSIGEGDDDGGFSPGDSSGSSGSAGSASFGADVIANYPPIVTLVSPNDEIITERNALFEWIPKDNDGDKLTFELNIKLVGSSLCLDEERSISNIEENFYLLINQLNCFYDDGDYYVWKVRAFDGKDFGPWSGENVLKLNSVVGAGVLNEFTPLAGSETGLGISLEPIVLENSGNVEIDVDLQATKPWINVDVADEYFKFKIADSVDNEGAFDILQSPSYYVPVPVAKKELAVKSLGYLPRLKQAQVDLLVKAPPVESTNSATSKVSLFFRRAR